MAKEMMELVEPMEPITSWNQSEFQIHQIFVLK